MARSTTLPRLCLAVCTIALAGVAVAEAQEPARRPFRRLFGESRDRPDAAQRFDLRLSATGTYDDSLLRNADEEPEGGAFPAASADAQYMRRFGTATLQVGGGTTVQYYPQSEARLNRSHSAGVDLTVPVGARQRLRVAQTASYATFATLLGLPGSVIADPSSSVPGGDLLNPGESLGISRDGGWQWNTHASFSRQFRRRGSLEARYSHARTDLATVQSSFNLGGIRYTHNLTRQAALVGGYSYQRGRSGLDNRQIEFHDIDLGVSYSRRLPGLRNTSISMSTGSALLTTESGREISLLGDVRLVHLMGRSWTAALGYHRGVDFIDVLAQAVASDSVTGTLNGFAGRRLETSLSTSYTRGNLGSSTGSAVTSLAAVARTQFALSRRLALDTQYIHYFHEFGLDAAIPGSIPREIRRNAVRAGLTWLVPLIR